MRFPSHLVNGLICLTFVLGLLGISPKAHSMVTPLGYRVVKSYPHDPSAFTQGLVYVNGTLIESTGLKGRSSIRQVKLDTGKPIKVTKIDAAYFGEGITVWNDKIIGLTWKSQKGFVWGSKDFKLKKTFAYSGEGWGITRNQTHLIMSDGTSELKFLNPENFKLERTVSVTLDGKPVIYLNELEWINGSVYANVWQTNFIVRIDPNTGKVTAVIDLNGLLATTGPISNNVDVLNGIAYDSENNRLFVTGKLWPKLFEIVLINKRDQSIAPLK